jgi:hypothetical protein
MGRGEVCTGFWCANIIEGNHLVDEGVDWRILKWSLRKFFGRSLAGLICLGRGKVVGCCEGSDETSGSIECGEFFDCQELLALEDGSAAGIT